MKKGSTLIFILGVFSSNAFAMNLQEFLKAVESKHKSVQALETAKEATELGKDAADIELVPVLTADAGMVNDKSPLGQFVFLGAKETKTNSYSLGLAKKFSTGTAMNLTASTYEVENSGIANPAYSSLQRFGVGSLGVGLSQSLWKDFFGHATRLRWERQEAATAAATGTFDLQKKQILVGAEAAYWNYIYAKENLIIGKASLERAKKIANWTQRRVNDGISDRADLLQAQALVSVRQLQLISAEDELAANKRALRDFLELSNDEVLPEMTGDISAPRPLNSFVDGKTGKVVAIDAYLASLDAKAKLLESRETEDKLRPDLILSGSYNTNAVEENMAQATQNWTDTDKPTTKVGLKFIYPFDLGPKNSARTAARKSALVAQLTSERKMLESESAWIELNRRYSEMTKRIEAATEISKLQLAAAKAQADLFNKGRAVTANVIMAEEDAGNAELNLTKLKSEQRKMEAQGRLFVVIEEK